MVGREQCALGEPSRVNKMQPAQIALWEWQINYYLWFLLFRMHIAYGHFFALGHRHPTCVRRWRSTHGLPYAFVHSHLLQGCFMLLGNGAVLSPNHVPEDKGFSSLLFNAFFDSCAISNPVNCENDWNNCNCIVALTMEMQPTLSDPIDL